MGDVEQLEELAYGCLRDHYGVIPVGVQVVSEYSFNTVFRFLSICPLVHATIASLPTATFELWSAR